MNERQKKQRDWALAWQQKRCQKSAGLLIESCMGLVHMWCGRMRGSQVPIEDLRSSGVEGILKAAERFDPSKGLFSASAHEWIKNEIMLEARRMSTVVTKAKSSLENRVQINSERMISDALSRGMSKEQALEETAQKLKTSKKHIEQCMAAKSGCVPLDDTHQQFSDGSTPSEQNATQSEHASLLQRVMDVAGLSEDERRMMSMRFQEDFTSYDMISADFDISRERVRQRVNACLVKMKTAMEKMDLEISDVL